MKKNRVYYLIKACIQLILIFIWLMIISKSDAYFSVYFLCGAFGVFSVFKNTAYQLSVNEMHRKMGLPGIIVPIIYAMIIVLSNYGLFSRQIFYSDGIVLFCISYIIAWNIIYFITRQNLICNERNANGNLLFLFTFIGFFSFYFLLLLFVLYPGILTPDSVTQITLAETVINSNHHPYYHTLLIKVILQIGAK